MYRTNFKTVRHNNNSINNNRYDFNRLKSAPKNSYRVLYSNSLRRYGRTSSVFRTNNENNRSNFTQSSSNNNKNRGNSNIAATRNVDSSRNGQILRNGIRACWNNRRNDNNRAAFNDNNVRGKNISVIKSQRRVTNLNGTVVNRRFRKNGNDFEDIDGPPGYGPLPVKQKTEISRLSKRKNDSCCSTQSSTITNSYSSPASSSNPRFSAPPATPTVGSQNGEKLARQNLPSSSTLKIAAEKSSLESENRRDSDFGDDRRLASLLLTFMFCKRRRFLADRQILRIAAICFKRTNPIGSRHFTLTAHWLRNFLFKNPSLLCFVDGINGHYSSWSSQKLTNDEFDDCAKFCRFYF